MTPSVAVSAQILCNGWDTKMRTGASDGFFIVFAYRERPNVVTTTTTQREREEGYGSHIHTHRERKRNQIMCVRSRRVRA